MRMRDRGGMGMKKITGKILGQIVLILFAVIVLYPLFFVFMTSFKSNFDVISNPFGMGTFKPGNYPQAWRVGRIGEYFLNSAFITLVTLALQMIVIVLASYSFAKLKTWGHQILFILFLTGLFVTSEMITVPNFGTMKNLGLIDTRISLVLPYVASGIALATYIATNYTIFIFNFQGVWSEFYWALIMIRTESKRTLQLGLMNFQSQFGTDYGVLAAGLVMATLPILVIYLAFSSQFIGGMTAGAVKG